MKVIEKNKIICFDVDETLIIHDYPAEVQHCVMEFNDSGFKQFRVPNFAMIDALKKNHAQGHHIIVWSQNGYEWVKEVTSKLKLTKYIHYGMCKPDFIFDDLRPEEFMKRAYIKPNWNDTRYKKG
jgi:phosphoserine phosphatase